MFENGRHEEKGLPVGVGQGCRDPRVAVSCFMDLQGRGMGSFWRTRAFLPRAGSFLKARNGLLPGAQKCPSWLPLWARA